MLKHIVAIAGFMAVSFAVQGLSHFLINKDHFDAIGFARPEPVIWLGLLVMVAQGLILSLALSAWRGQAVTVQDGIVVALAFGLFLVSYIALVEPAKYAVPSIPAWFRVEAVAGLVQFFLFGLLLGFVHKHL